MDLRPQPSSPVRGVRARNARARTAHAPVPAPRLGAARFPARNRIEPRRRALGGGGAAWCLLAFLPLALACAPDTGAEAGGGDLAGPDQPLDVALEDVYRVGALVGHDWELFSRVSRVSFDGQGNLYVFDSQAQRVTVVDPTGAHLRTVGSAGDGPGEFRMSMGMAVFDDGRVVVHDLGHRALMVFGPDGAFAENVPVDMGGIMPGTDMAPHPAGGLVSADGLVIQMGGPGDEPPPEPTSRPVTWFGLDGSAPRTLFDAWLMPPPEAETQSVSAEGGGFQVNTPPMVAFEPEVRVAVFPDGRLAVVDSTAYRIRVLDADGNQVDVLERPIQPRPVGDRDRDAERARQLERLTGPNAPQVRMVMEGGGSGGPPADFARRLMEQRVESMLFADEIPAIAGLAVDRDGRLWVERTGPEVGEPGPTDLVGPDGTYLGTLPPDGVRTPQAFGPDGLVAYVETDEMDVPTVAVRRLPRELR